jgi:branched-chain amino acid transport system substrate-binding protein
MKRRLTTALVALILLTIPYPGAAADPVQIDVIMSLTGPIAFIGKEEQQSIQVMEGMLNAAGGIGGRPIKFAIQDDQSSPQVAVQLTTQLLAKKARLILGPSAVANCSAVAPLIKDDAVMYCWTPGFHPQKGSYAFSAGVSTADAMAFIVRYLRGRGIQKLGMIAGSDANGQDSEQSLANALALPENREMKVVADERFNPADLTVAAQMERIKGSGAQALITFSSGTPFGTVLRGFNDAGLQIPVLTSPASLNVTVMHQFARFLPKDLLIAGVPSDAPDVVPSGPLKTQIAQYLTTFKNAGVTPDHSLASVWDPVLIVVNALKKYGVDAAPAQIHDYIENLRWIGANGEYDFRDGSQRGLTTKLSVMVRWDADKDAFVAVSRPGGGPLGTK